MKQQQGFTLIELIVVIVILGILAATAMPKFADLKDDAHKAALKGLGSAMISAATIAHASQLAKGYASGVSVTIEGATVAMVNGYPTAATGGIGNAVSSNEYSWQAGAGMGKNTTCYMSYTESVGGALPVIGAASSIAGC